jgi:hypothetical protein
MQLGDESFETFEAEKEKIHSSFLKRAKVCASFIHIDPCTRYLVCLLDNGRILSCARNCRPWRRLSAAWRE